MAISTKILLLLAAAASAIGACNALVDAPPAVSAPADASADGNVRPSEDAPSASSPADAAPDAAPDAHTADAGRPEASAREAGGEQTDAASCNADLQNDQNNCGWCGHSCLGTGCVAGLCAATPVVAPQNQLQGLYDIVVDPGVVYFTEWCGPALVWEQTFAGSGSLTPLASLDGTCATGIVQYGGTLYYGNVLSNGANLMSVTLEAGAPALLAATTNAVLEPMGVDTSRVYYNVTSGAVGIYSVARDGGTPVPLYQGDVGRLVALDANVYFTVPSASLIMTVRKDGSSVATPLYSPLSDSGALGVDITGDAVDVYWSDSSGVVYRGARDGSGYAALTPAVLGAGARLAVDDKTVYFGNPPGKPLMGVAKDGGNLRTYTSPLTANVTAIGFDAQYVYYAIGVQHPASIWRVPK